MSEKGEEYGDDEFYELCAEAGTMNSRDAVKHLLAAIAKHRGRAEQSDDLTIVTVQRKEG